MPAQLIITFREGLSFQAADLFVEHLERAYGRRAGSLDGATVTLHPEEIVGLGTDLTYVDGDGRTVQAMQWSRSSHATPASLDRICRWVNDGPRPPLLDGEEEDGDPIIDYVTEGGLVVDVSIFTTRQHTRLYPGHWVVRREDGHYEVHPPGVFESTYTKAS